MHGLFAVLIVLLSSVYGASSLAFQDCNPLSCLYQYNSLFISGHENDACRKFKNLKSCVIPCLRQLSVDFDVIGQLDVLELKICKDQEERNTDVWQKKCPGRKKFQFASCLYEAWHLVSAQQSNDSRLLKCRRLSEAEFCPSSVFAHCEETTQAYVEDLLLKLFAPSKMQNCYGYSNSDVWDYATKSGLLHQKDFQLMSKCFDMHHEEIMSCIPDKWTLNYLINRHIKKEICIAFPSFINCIKNELVVKCNRGASKLFEEYGKSVFQIFLPHCLETSSQASSAAKTELLISPADGKSYPDSESVLPDTSSASEDPAEAKPLNGDGGDVTLPNLLELHGNESQKQLNPASEIIVIHLGMLSLNGASSVHISLSLILCFLLLWLYTLL